MRPLLLLTTGVTLFLFPALSAFAQLQIFPNSSASALAQKIAGEGVFVSNATLTGGQNAKGFFINRGNTQIGIDSGVVLTTGRAKTAGSFDGMDGDGFSSASSVDASNAANLPGDADLASTIGVALSNSKDACILEFDFIPVGDTIKFNYVFSSEEYQPSFVCDFNDAFAFFISGPGITGLKNIALIPGTNTPVSIFNVNNVRDPFTTLCPNNTQYYVDNASNVFFTHDGHTTVLTAISEVQPCQTYHLKMVIMDVGDAMFDSGVFLEAGSLRSDPLKIDAHTPLNEFNLPYLAEGCVPGAIHVTRSRKKPYPQTLNLLITGTAINGVDVAPIALSHTIPANDSVVIIPVSAIADLVAEGHEMLKIYIGNSCANVFSDSIEIEIRDIDILTITPADSIRICRNSSVQLTAASGYVNYTWTNASTLSVNGINNPLASPGSASTNYVCTATIGYCTARDSVLVKWKTITLQNKTDIPCKNGTTGTITVTGTGWQAPVSYAINNNDFQADNTFTGLAAGTYWVKMKDISGCTDSIQVNLIQTFPDISISTIITEATCSITPDGNITVTANGGNGIYNYSSNGTSYQSGNTLIVPEGTYTVYVKDGNGCIETLTPVMVSKINTIIIDAEPDLYICEGTSRILNATSNVTDINWTPAIALSNTTSLTPTTTITGTIKYFVTASFGTCTRTDSLVVNVWNAPAPDAGDDIPICFGITAQLNGSGGEEYEWTSHSTFISGTNIKDPVVKPSATTIYYLHVKDIHGCRSLHPDEMQVIVTPAVKIFAGRDTLVAINQPLQLNAIETNNSGVTDWKWADTRYLSNPFIASPLATFTSPVALAPYEYTYTVTGTTPEGCQGSDEIKIKVYQGPEIYVPSAFTPNNDGKNDQLISFPVGLKEFRFLHVFNRWGQIVFSTQNPSRGWDGRVTGTDQPTGIFIWTAEGIDYTGKTITRKGTTTLIR
ncbi:MAG: choice-of-anchor L domain-containing protein [Chitinophagaceae bacterium]|nr:choice-of-anchor L domain-containing protein [Chitinophagaceae bacterium]